MITLRDYQEKALSQLTDKFKSGKREVVLSASPSSGKTIMTLEFIRRNPKLKFLILTHGQSVLRTMWENEIKKFLSEEDQSRIVYGLPQTLKNQELNKIDVLIIDEAHEFTFASMVKGIREKVKAKKTLFLTGTPSKFIKQGYDCIIIPASELINKGFISDLYVGLFSTNIPLKKEDYNNDLNSNNGGDKKLEKSTTKDLDNLLEAMTVRLKQSKHFKSQPRIGWQPNLEALSKTMIACNSIKQAANVVKYFEKHNINVISSNSKNDINSDNIKKFQEDTNIKVLVVVDRAILGFNMPELVNVVDMTCSHNIDRIYQLYARVMRINPEHEKKYFFKMTSDNEMAVTKFYMSAALLMLTEEFISKYNGKNLNAFKVPEIVIKRERNKDNNQKSNKKPLKKKIAIEEAFYNEVSSYKVLEDLMNKCDNDLNEYAYTTFNKLKSELFGTVRQIVNITEENLLWMIKHGKVDERIYG
jgi:superfamily II DNA or RNA helicase